MKPKICDFESNLFIKVLSNVFGERKFVTFSRSKVTILTYEKKQKRTEKSVELVDLVMGFFGARNKQSRKPENNKKHRKGLSPPMMERAKNARFHELL